MAVAKKKAVPANAEKPRKPIGAVTHYYGGIGVAIVKFSVPIKAGTAVAFKGATTDFAQTLDSMQFDHQEIEKTAKGQEVGVKVKEKVREGDEVFAGE